MKVRSKLIIGFVAVSMTTAIVGGIGWWGMNQSSNSITRLGRENVPSILSLETIKSSLLEIKVVIRTLMDINVNKEEFQRQFDNLAKSRITYGKSINDYDSSRKTKEEENFWKVFSTDLDDLKKADNIFFEYIKTQADKGTDFHKIQNDIEARGFAAKPPFDKAMGSFQNLMDYVNNYYGKEQIDRTVASTMMISSTMLIVLLLSIAVAIILAASFGNMLTKPLSKMEKGLKSMADGDLQIKLNSESNDEFGKISESYNTVRDSLMNMVSDTEMLTKAAIEGQLAKRADSSRHQGDFKKIVDGVNKTLDSVIGPLNVTAKYIDDISRGEIPPVITDNFYGDFNIIKNNLNTCIGAINKMVEDANILVQAGMEGRLDTRADTSKHQGDFKKIVDGVNRTL
ncbi:MAG: MCP four helix bundle domain-containing protein, partial [Brevinematales bacterium]